MGSATGDFASRASSRRYQPSRLFLTVLLLAAFSAAVEGLQYAAAGSTAARIPVQPPHSDIITHNNRQSLPSSMSLPAREITTTTGVDGAADAPSTPTLSPTVDCESKMMHCHQSQRRSPLLPPPSALRSPLTTQQLIFRKGIPKSPKDYSFTFFQSKVIFLIVSLFFAACAFCSPLRGGRCAVIGKKMAFW